MAKRTLVRAAAVLGAASLALAGCSSDSGDDSASGSGSSASATTVSTDCTPEQATAAGAPSTAPLKIGTLLPDTGSLSFLGPPMVAGTQLGVNDVNAAGGVLGQPVQLIPGDSGDTTTDTANTTVDRELAAGTQVIIGAASSSVSLKVIDKVSSAGVVMFSPANTSDQFVCYPDKGQYFRTAPTDVLQAQAVSQLISDDGGQRVSILALNDPYGTGLADNIQKNLVDAGIPGDQIQKIIYDPNAQSFNSEVDQVKDFAPDAVAVVGFEESAKIITRMHEVGIGPSDGMKVYGVDGNMGNALGESVAAPLLDGMQGTTPLTDVGPAFQDRLKAINPGLIDFNYAGESYDAVVISALAAEAGKSTAGRDIAANINAVTEGGTPCTSYQECLPLVQAGTDIDYNGITGKLDFAAAGEPSIGSYGKLKFGADNKLTTEGYIVVGG
ncbi:MULTISPECIES: ABC transporter substrate-binding protein [unclassified Rhodococcus (in: high G+C Gram-positive bacteria)]|uniref:ABC transporter substrate-binding protein n=1 Tax=unclassified Rhodococcus (in: high G+C Gram-positive bacteria) TaxID=192944 RepID=UPI00163B5135|nr:MULTISPECIES: ABC transporter substrate-binding protein [unclassified Rhodococcus (in: high G+C Gram-positive bacteria)]MBC2638453.1 ABC transporter substrate-binding protein [Rhodococcus sp. 3A]MBC2896806.1 ABC transporter substrate-binding protein [Rhodococcus sp. 4CII]